METVTPLTPKEQYSQWCLQQPAMPVFMHPWWMDAVCAGKQWDVMLYKNPRTDVILAALPYLIRKRYGMRYIIMPQMTQIGGVWFDHTLCNNDGSVWDKETEEQIYNYFNQQLQNLKLDYYYQQYPLNSVAPQGMRKQGFTVKERVTYRLEDLTDLDAVIEKFSRNKKRQLQKALSLHAEKGLTAEEFYRWHEQCLKEKNKKISYSREFLLVLERKSKRQNQSEIIGIYNADNELYAAAYVVWDNIAMHYLIAAQDEKHEKSGAMALLVLECIKLAREKKVVFDFEGSMIQGVAAHFKQFGAMPATYYSVQRYYHWWMRIPLFFYHIFTFRQR